MEKNIPEWYKIPEISFEKYISYVLEIYKNFEDVNKDFILESNKEDIFLKKIMMSKNNWNDEEWYTYEKNRILQKNLEMKIGYFHENISSSIKGYTKIINETNKDKEPHCDIINIELNEIFELKNKENTMNSDSKRSVFNKLKMFSLRGMKTYLVYINKWTKKNKIKDNLIILSGKDFYNKISGRDTFYDDFIETVTYTFLHYKNIDELLSL
jgi:hypothetical protein